MKEKTKFLLVFIDDVEVTVQANLTAHELGSIIDTLVRLEKELIESEKIQKFEQN